MNGDILNHMTNWIADTALAIDFAGGERFDSVTSDDVALVRAGGIVVSACRGMRKSPVVGGAA